MSSITIQTPVYYGNKHDGVVEFAALTQDNGTLEVGCYFSDDKPKHIIGISSQIGCPSRCNFCELGNEKFTRNLSALEMYDQVTAMQSQLTQLSIDYMDKPLKVSVAKTGEPMFNPNLVGGLEQISVHNVSYKVSTVFPDAKTVYQNFKKLARFATSYIHPVQLQISLLSTNEQQRRETAGIPVANLRQIQEVGNYWKTTVPNSRDINLSIIVSENIECRVEDVKDILDPSVFRFRFRPYVPTQNGAQHNLETMNEQKLIDLKTTFREAGYIVTDWPTPTKTEWQHLLAANVTRKRWMEQTGKLIALKTKK